MARNDDATLEWARAQLALVRRTVGDVYVYELDNEIGGAERREGLAAFDRLVRVAADALREVVRDYPVALRPGKPWEPGDPMNCSRCRALRTNYVVSPDGFILCLRCVPRDRLVVR